MFCCECSILQETHRLEEENTRKEMELHYDKLTTYLFKNEVAMGEVLRKNEIKGLEKKYRSMNDMLRKENAQLNHEVVGRTFTIKNLRKDIEYFKSKSRGFKEKKMHENRNRSRYKH